MAEIVDLIEDAIVADFRLDDLLSQYLPRKHDYRGAKGVESSEYESHADELPFAIAITATDRGDFKQVPGAGLKLVGLEIEIQWNAGATGGDASTLAALADRASKRIPPIQFDSDESRQILGRFSNNYLRLCLISASESEKRTDVDLSRFRTIARELIAIAL